MGALFKLFFDAVKSGKVYVISIGLTTGAILFCPWEKLTDRSNPDFWYATIFIFCISFVLYLVADFVWATIKKRYEAGTRAREMKAKLAGLHEIEKKVLLMFARTGERFITIPIDDLGPDIERHLSHLYVHELLESYHPIDGSYRALGPVAYKCHISDRLWDLFTNNSFAQSQRIIRLTKLNSKV